VFLVQDQVAEYEGIIIFRNVRNFIPSPSYAIFSYVGLNKFFKSAPIYFTYGNERSETRLAEEYSWAITQARGGRSVYSVLEFGFQIDCLLY